MTDRTCPACGRSLLSTAGIGATLADDARRAADAYRALVERRLAVPDEVPTTLRDLAGRWPHLAAELLHHAGVCPPGAAEDVPW